VRSGSSLPLLTLLSVHGAKTALPNTSCVNSNNETVLKSEQSNFHINDFVTVHFDRLSSHGRDIAFLIKNNLIFNIIQLDFNPKALEVEAISISKKTSKNYIILTTYYRTHKNNITLNEWQTFLNSVTKNGDKFLIGGDLNAHHFSWGSNHNCHNGNIIYNFTNPAQFEILNNGNITHVVRF